MTEKKRVFVVEISPVVADDGSTQKFLFSTKAFGTLSTDTPPNTRVRNCLRNPGTFKRNLFANARVTGAITPDYGNIILANKVPEKGGPGELDDWVDYGLAGSVVNVYWGTPGDAYPSAWTFVYTAFCHSFVADATEVVLRLRDQLQLLDQPLVTESFAGTGGLEGTGGVSKPKQWVSGDPGFIEPILLDVNKQIYYVQSTGTYFTSLTDTSNTAWGLFEGGSRLTHDGATPYASLDQLQGVEPPPGTFRYYFGPNNPMVSGWYDGPVYFRLGTPPITDLRVFPIGVPSSADMTIWGGAYGSFTVPSLAMRAGVSRDKVDTDSAIAVASRLVNDSATYLDVMADAALSQQGWFGFDRLGVFRSGYLLDPNDTQFYYGVSSGSGITPLPTPSPTTSLHTFDADKVVELRREPVSGMEVPIWNVTLNAGDTWPSALVTGASPQMKDYLTRTPKWLTTSGVSSSTLLANPGAAKDTVEIHSRILQNSFSCRLWLERYFVLYGGRRHFFTFSVPMTDELLALDMHDVVTLQGSRYGLSSGKKFRIISLTLDCSTKVPYITYGLWGGTAGQYTGAVGGGTGGGGGGGNSNADAGTTLAARQLGNFTGSMIGEVSAANVVPLPAIDCVLLLHLTGANGATSFLDTSGHNHVMTTVQNTAVSNAVTLFGQNSAFFDGTQDILSTPDHVDWTFGTGDFTFECWAYKTVANSNTRSIIGSAVGTGYYPLNISVDSSDNIKFAVCFADPAAQTLTGTTYAFSNNTWHHVAMCRQGSNFYIFLDGVELGAGSRTVDSRALYDAAAPLCIGNLSVDYNTSGGTVQSWFGYLRELRITKSALYTTNFTPPTGPFGDSVGGPLADPNCCLYYNQMRAYIGFDGSQGGTSFPDSGPIPLSNLTGTSIYAARDTTIKKFGTASLKITNRSSDGASIADTASLGNSAGQPISIELWFYVQTWPSNVGAQLFDLYSAGGGVGAWVGITGSSSTLKLTWNFGAGGSPTGSITISMSTWHHLAVIDDGTGAVKLYLDGVLDTTLSAGTFARATSNKLCIGGYHAYGAATSTSGEVYYIDSFEYVVGYQTRTAAFTPPTEATYAVQCTPSIAAPPNQQTVIDNFTGSMMGTVYSPPGLSWTARDSSRAWFGVASNSDGTILVATVVSGLIYRSTDSGATWASPGGSSLAWWGICSSSDGVKLAAVVNSGQIYTSTDSGANWTARDSSRGWRYIACSDDGATLVACVYGGQIYNSTDSGVTWTARDSSRNWNGVACSSDGTKWVASVDGGQLYVSTDSGVTWAAKDSNRNWRNVASSADGSKLVAVVFTGQIYTSTDSGANWTARDSSRGWFGVASSDDGVTLAATEITGNIYISTDSGVTWTSRASALNWRQVAGSSDLSVMVAAVSSGQIYSSP